MCIRRRLGKPGLCVRLIFKRGLSLCKGESMYRMRELYVRHELKLSLKYVCSCGHKMTRINSDYYSLWMKVNSQPINSDYYTMSSFNHHTEEACEANLNYSVFTQKRKCPKCGNTIQPVLSKEIQRQVEEWNRIYDDDCARINKSILDTALF